MLIKILLMMLKNDLIHKIMTLIDHCLKKKKKVIGFIKDKLGRKIMTEVVALKPKHVLT